LTPGVARRQVEALQAAARQLIPTAQRWAWLAIETPKKNVFATRFTLLSDGLLTVQPRPGHPTSPDCLACVM
jgi:hypothetical protein